MKKLFILLLIALVPLSIGCRLTENDDAGPDIKQVTYPRNNIVINAEFEVASNVVDIDTASPPANIKAFAWGDIFYTISLDTGNNKVYVDNYVPLDNGKVRLKFKPKTIDATNLSGTSPNVATITFQFAPGFCLDVSIKVSKLSTNSSSVSAINNVKVDTTYTPTEGLKISSVKVTFETGETVEPQQDTTQKIPSSTIENALYVKNVLWGTATITTSLSDTATIDDLTPTFDVYLNASYTNTTEPTWTWEVSNLKDNVSFRISSTDSEPGFTITSNDTKDKITFTITSTAEGKKLEADKQYKVELIATNLERNGVKLTVPQVRYFITTASATVKDD